MTDVKRYDCTNGGYRHCQGCYEMTETPLGDYVRSEDYDALAAKLAMAEDAAAKGDAARQQCGGMEMEIEELRAELAELRSRAVVVPDAANDRRKSAHYCRGWNACLDELARLNGKTVSEGLLRRVTADPDYEEVFAMSRGEALTELRALLNQDKENGDHAA
ncbi:TPA: hypothetical protein ACXNR9_006001 [Pseudomonas aeruginosa]|nr:hypothetical protein [Pseudomonas aeruginosa]HBP4578254.1 hypothetical protein [Pseudomonas aeruginosa]HCT6664989.1 hypothetical protein [Pseudomonas aeruginosa]